MSTYDEYLPNPDLDTPARERVIRELRHFDVARRVRGCALAATFAAGGFGMLFAAVAFGEWVMYPAALLLVLTVCWAVHEFERTYTADPATARRVYWYDAWAWEALRDRNLLGQAPHVDLWHLSQLRADRAKLRTAAQLADATDNLELKEQIAAAARELDVAAALASAALRETLGLVAIRESAARRILDEVTSR